MLREFLGFLLGSKAPSPRLGPRGERLAVRHLEKKGYRIVKRNHRSRRGEIDIIALEGETLVFVEVKTRGSLEFGSPLEAVADRKRKHMERAATEYLAGMKTPPAARFDVMAIELSGRKIKIEHIEDAFEASGKIKI